MILQRAKDVRFPARTSSGPSSARQRAPAPWDLTVWSTPRFGCCAPAR